MGFQFFMAIGRMYGTDIIHGLYIIHIYTFPRNIFKIVTMENTYIITNLTCKQNISIIYNQQLFFDNSTKIELLIL